MMECIDRGQKRIRGALIVVACVITGFTISISAQEPAANVQPADRTPQTATRGWQRMHDGVAFLTFNHQSGPRGGSEFKSQNWWMGMAGRQLSAGVLNVSTMLSLDPATVGKRGYRELFQSGEAANGLPIIDRQHPHDFVGQLAASWRMPLNERTGLTIAGGPVAETGPWPRVFCTHLPKK